MFSSSLSAKLCSAALIVVVFASPLAAQNNLSVADLKAYGDDADATTYALLSDDKITFADTGATSGVLTWDVAGTEFEMDNDLKLTAGGFWIGANQIIDSSRNFGNIANSTGSTNVVFSSSPTITTPTFAGTVSGAAMTLTGVLTLPDGTAAAPALRFTTGTDDGLYQSGDGFVDVAIGGARVARFGSSEFWSVQDVFLNGAADVIFDVDRDTYLSSPSDDVFDFYVAGVRAGGFDALGDFDFVGDVDAVNLVLSGTATGMTNVSGTGNIALVNSPTFVTPTLGAASATSLALSGTLTGATNVSGTGNFALVGSPAFTGTVTGVALDFSGDVEADTFSISGTEVIADDLSTNFGEVNATSVVSTGAVSGTTGTFTGNVTTTASMGVGDATPNRKFHVVAGAGTVPAATDATDVVALFQNNDATGENVFAALVSGTAGTAAIAFGDADDENAGQFTYDNSSNQFRFRQAGGSTSLTLDSSRTVIVESGVLRLGADNTPASASDTGTAGDVVIDNDYIYVATGTDTWKRAALSTW